MSDYVISARIRDEKLIAKILEHPLSNTELVNRALHRYFSPENDRIHNVYKQKDISKGHTLDDETLQEIDKLIKDLDEHIDEN